MDRNIRIARELVRIAKELVAFKGAQKIIDAISEMTGWDKNNEDDFKKIDEWKNNVIQSITNTATVDGKVRDVYFDWLRNCACNGEIEWFIKKNPSSANDKKASFFTFKENILLKNSDIDLERNIAFLFHGNSKCQDTINEINKRIKSKSISIEEMQKIITPLRKQISETTNDEKRTSLMKKFESLGKKVYSNGSWSVFLFDDIRQRQDLIDFAGHCTRWCITGKGQGGDNMFNTYSDKYYVICKGNLPICCFYNCNGVTWFEMDNGTRFNSKNEEAGFNRKDVHELYDKSDATTKELIKDVIPDICNKLGFKLKWKIE